MTGPGLRTKKRVFGFTIIFTTLIFALVVRVGWVQLIEGSDLSQKAFEQQNRDREISPRRGVIYDRNGKELAVSAVVGKIVVNPTDLKNSKKDLDQVSGNLAELLSINKDEILKKIQKNSRYEVIKRRVDKEVTDKVLKWRQTEKIDSIYIDEDTMRFYPNNNLASHVVGFTGEDNQGLYGTESIAEEYLKGVPGKILSEVDAGGHAIPFKEEKRIDPKEGLNVILTIDETIQHFADKALDKAIVDNKILRGATAVVLDPRNGDVLALVSKPDFNLNSPKAAPPGVDATNWKGNTDEDIKKLQETVWRNKAVTDTYEPGSTFKAITSAAGLEEGVVNLDSPVSDFTITVMGKNINCWKPNAHGAETFAQGVYNSCNPVFVKVSQNLGIERFYNYVRAFGFYEKTGITLSGEAGSIIHKKPTELDMATASFGQRFQISPIQLISAYGAIANGGKLMKPRLIKELSDSDGNIVKKFEPVVVRNVISLKTSDTLRGVLEGVVSNGTGANAYVKGYRVAGKTGTSETTESGRYIASFSAIAPADNPVICVLVVLDYPSGDSYYGGVIAAPVAGKIVEDTLNYLEVERRYSEKDKATMTEEVAVPDVRGKTLDEAKKMLAEFGLEYKIENNGGTGNIVKDQTPKPYATVPKKSVIILYNGDTTLAVTVTMPDLTNKTVSEATQELNGLGINIKVNGDGVAKGQSISAGSSIVKGSLVTVDFRSMQVD